MNTSEEIRAMAKACAGYETTVGFADPVAFARVLHSKVPKAGYDGERPLDVLVVDALEALVRKQKREPVRDPKNWVLRVFGDLVTGKDVPTTTPAKAYGDDQEWREVRNLHRSVCADRGRNTRVEAIEQWRRDRLVRPMPTPWWALYGFDCEADYAARSTKQRELLPVARFDEPKGFRRTPRGQGTLEDAIEGSRELRDQSELIELDELEKAGE